MSVNLRMEASRDAAQILNYICTFHTATPPPPQNEIRHCEKVAVPCSSEARELQDVIVLLQNRPHGWGRATVLLVNGMIKCGSVRTSQGTTCTLTPADPTHCFSSARRRNMRRRSSHASKEWGPAKNYKARKERSIQAESDSAETSHYPKCGCGIMKGKNPVT
ncbi:hypothetical protein AVEN_219730-1 [Araneus ventricosus]|uniref:Uncharacterized protein n=1 Tax=Araneus ventricosus TaxID=182803 RepID=A0A4Y2MHT9_ARAVE|nr:hypothetical protein AVEN_219730-1 [Araneus ventricosus]